MSPLEHTHDGSPHVGEAAEPGLEASQLPILDVDEQLLALPAPPRGERAVAMVLMAMVVVAASVLAMGVRTDVAYLLSSDSAQDLGRAPHLNPAQWESNRFATVQGTPMLSGMVHFHQSLGGTQYVLFPLAGQRNLFIQVPASQMTNRRQVIATRFSGRLMTFRQLGGRYSDVVGHVKGSMGMTISPDSFVLMAGEPPGSHAWSAALMVFCLGVIGFMMLLMRRWFRPLKW